MIRRGKNQRSEKHNRTGQSKKSSPGKRLLLINRYEIRDPTQKLLIRPMLMRGRAQAFCFDESARGSRKSGMSVSSRKSRYSLIATRMSSRSSSGVLMEFSARRRGEIHEGSVPFFPASMDCAPQGLERTSPGLFASLMT